jgi:hypothetical protein
MSIDFPKEEERILKRWEEIDAFQTQVELVCFLHFQHTPPSPPRRNTRHSAR